MTTDPKTDEMTAWLEHKAMERAVDYSGRGRAHASLSLEELTNAFVGAFRAYANAPSATTRDAENDLESEFRLRGLKPPLDLVPDAVEALVQKSRDAHAEILRDPDRMEEMGEDITWELADFRRQQAEKKN